MKYLKSDIPVLMVRCFSAAQQMLTMQGLMMDARTFEFLPTVCTTTLALTFKSKCKKERLKVQGVVTGSLLSLSINNLKAWSNQV